MMPLLESDNPVEQWASALELGKMREPSALPTLLSILTEQGRGAPAAPWPLDMGIRALSPSGDEYSRRFPLSQLPGRMKWYGAAECAQNLAVPPSSNVRTGTDGGDGLVALLHALQRGPGTAQDLVGAWAGYWGQLLPAETRVARHESSLPRIRGSACPCLARRDLAGGADLCRLLPPRQERRDAWISPLPRARPLPLPHVPGIRHHRRPAHRHPQPPPAP